MYAGSFVGQPLYCSTPQNPLYYSPETTPFIALPVEDYQSGAVRCGAPYHIRFADGSTLTARAYDAGPFSRFCVRQADGSCPSIGVDVPVYWWPVEGISGWVEITPITQWAREAHCTSCAGGDVVAPSPPEDAPLPPAQGVR